MLEYSDALGQRTGAAALSKPEYEAHFTARAFVDVVSRDASLVILESVLKDDIVEDAGKPSQGRSGLDAEAAAALLFAFSWFDIGELGRIGHKYLHQILQCAGPPVSRRRLDHCVDRLLSDKSFSYREVLSFKAQKLYDAA